jgi:ABC-type Co2+ transport system, permease component
MHIPDGFISPHISLPAYAAAAPVWLLAIRKFLKSDLTRVVPIVGSLTAVACIIQSLMIPIPGGTSAHLAGCTLIAVLYNPLMAFLCETLVLLIQSLILGMGGITTLPINALAIGFMGPLSGWLLYKLLRRFHEKAALFVAGYVGMAVPALVIACVLGLQHIVSEKHMPLPFSVILPAVLIPHLAVMGVLEGLYTMFGRALLQKVAHVENS